MVALAAEALLRARVEDEVLSVVALANAARVHLVIGAAGHAAVPQQALRLRAVALFHADQPADRDQLADFARLHAGGVIARHQLRALAAVSCLVRRLVQLALLNAETVGNIVQRRTGDSTVSEIFDKLCQRALG